MFNTTTNKYLPTLEPENYKSKRIDGLFTFRKHFELESYTNLIQTPDEHVLETLEN